jgi:acyl-CoA thioesterase FadM
MIQYHTASLSVLSILCMNIPEFTTHEDVMFFDTDCAGVVNNIAYLRMIETCRTHLGAKMGMDFQSMSSSQLYPAVLRSSISSSAFVFGALLS